MTADHQCATCAAFFDYTDGSNRGECRRHAPVLSGDCDLPWPQVAYFEWCFEFIETSPNGEGGAS